MTWDDVVQSVNEEELVDRIKDFVQENDTLLTQVADEAGVSAVDWIISVLDVELEIAAEIYERRDKIL
tara:strand:+ start:63 stop:266 length:204 start_codon:yes stop_codon:yes gene_type:complete